MQPLASIHQTSLLEALSNAEQNHIALDEIGTSHRVFGGRVYFIYDANNGWKVQRFDIIDRILRALSIGSYKNSRWSFIKEHLGYETSRLPLEKIAKLPDHIRSALPLQKAEALFQKTMVQPVQLPTLQLDQRAQIMRRVDELHYGRYDLKSDRIEKSLNQIEDKLKLRPDLRTGTLCQRIGFINYNLYSPELLADRKLLDEVLSLLNEIGNELGIGPILANLDAKLYLREISKVVQNKRIHLRIDRICSFAPISTAFVAWTPKIMELQPQPEKTLLEQLNAIGKDLGFERLFLYDDAQVHLDSLAEKLGEGHEKIIKQMTQLKEQYVVVGRILLSEYLTHFSLAILELNIEDKDFEKKLNDIVSRSQNPFFR